MGAAVDLLTYCNYLHNPHSTLDVGDPDSDVYVVATACVLVYEDSAPIVKITNVRVLYDLDSDMQEEPTEEQLAFWDLESRVLEFYLWAEQECDKCKHKLRSHVEHEEDTYFCTEQGCLCSGMRVEEDDYA